MSGDGVHKPGDIVNGHILGSDNQWHPLMPGVSDSPPEASVSSAVPDPTETPISEPSVQVAKSGWSGLSRAKKAGLVGGGALGLLIVAGLAGGGGEQDSSTPQASEPAASASSGNTPSATGSPRPVATPDPDVATYWATLSAEEQAQRCALYRSSDPASAVDGLTYNTSNTKDVVQAHLEQVCPVPPPPPPKDYVALDERTWQLIAKDPDAYAGQTFLVFGEVTQFDAATGDDTFRADIAHTNTCNYGFFDGDNTLLTAGPGVSLANVVSDDVFAAQVTVVGSMSYDTQIGGSTTVPVLQVDSIEVQPTRCDF